MTFTGVLCRVIWAVTVAIWAVTAPQVGRAHEVLPTIADLSIQDNGMLKLEFRLNIEALLSGIDLDAVENTDAAEGADDYTALRALSVDALGARVADLIQSWEQQGVIVVDGAVAALTQNGLEIPQVADLEQPRVSTLTVVADAPDGQFAIINWPAGSGALVVRQQGVEEPYTGYLDGGQSSPAIALAGGGAQTGWQAFVSYIPVGFDHILPKGLDHILFVLGLFFLSTRLKPLVWQISAFTLAHTVTLALGALGWVSVPGSVVEPLIAASIVYVAVENLFTSGLNPWRPFVIFGFGLLHGLGFASVLAEFGLPDAQFVPALIGFNVGVEFGQLTVIALAFLAVGWFAKQPWYRSRIAVPASCVIALVGAWWFVERVFL